MVSLLLDGEEIEDNLPVYAAQQVLPAGDLTRPAYGMCAESARLFANSVLAATGRVQPEHLDVDCNIDGTRLVGRLHGLYPSGLIRYRNAKLKAKDRIRGWIHNLLLCAAGHPERTEIGTLLIGKDASCHFPFVEDSHQQLSRLIAILRRGLGRPLPFFPETSFIFAERQAKEETQQDSLARACQKWLGGLFNSAECDDADFDFCFRHSDPLDDEFCQLALDILSPLIASLNRWGK